MSRITSGAVRRLGSQPTMIGTSKITPSMTAITAARSRHAVRDAARDEQSEAKRWLKTLGMTDWRLAGAESASGTAGLPKIQLAVGGGGKRMRFTHPEQEAFEIKGAGVIGSVGVGLSPVTVSVSTYNMLSRNFGNVFATPAVRGELQPRDFTRFLNVVEAGCAAGVGGSLVLYVFSSIPVTLMGGWLTARAVTAAAGTASVFDASCSLAGKTYYMWPV